jgi:hypothetical protein
MSILPPPPLYEMDINSKVWKGWFSRIPTSVVQVDGTQDIVMGTGESWKVGDASNNSEFEQDGTLKFNGDATVWNDVNIGSVSLGAGATAPDLIVLGGGGNTIQIRAFDGNSTTEQLFFELEIPHSTKVTSNITFHVHWCPTTANAGNVKWQLNYVLYGENITLPAEQTISTVSTSNGTAWKMQRTDLPVISVTSINRQLCGRLFRHPGDAADTYPDDAGVFTVGFHYEQDTIGSRQITTK